VAALLKNTRDWDDSAGSYNPLIYGNDVDSVDIATRVAMVSDAVRICDDSVANHGD
jgi:hypothetical protein